MTGDYVSQRKEYVRQAREAFGTKDSRPLNQFSAADIEEQPEEVSGLIWVKVRLLLAFFLFLSYLLCDFTKMELYGYSSGEIATQIEEDSLSLKQLRELNIFTDTNLKEPE